MIFDYTPRDQACLRSIPLTRKISERLRLARAAMTWADTADAARQAVREGRRDDARWWGAQARSDWRALYHLLTH